MGRGRISWSASQEKRLRDAVRAFNSTITRLEKTGKYDVLPNRVNIETEKSRIMTRDQLYQREKELNRFLMKNKKKAQDVVEVDGVSMPSYLVTEFKNVLRSNNKKREELRNKIVPDLANKSAPEQATYYANKNLIAKSEHVEDPYDYADRLDEEVSEKYFSDVLYMDNYIAVLTENFLDIADGIIEIILKLQEKPGALREIMESPDMEKEINYLYPDKDLTKYQEKRRNLLRYWDNVAKKYGL